MAAKILINAKAGMGKTSLIQSLTDAYVISRDGKDFAFEIPHTVFTDFVGMQPMIDGYDITEDDGTVTHVDGILDKLFKYKEAFGKLPTTIVWDSVSQTLQDIIDYSNVNFKNFDVHSNINKEVATLTKFIQEYLVANGINVVLMNHIFWSESEGGYVMTGQGKFREKGGFYSVVDHAVCIEMTGAKRYAFHSDPTKLARTLIPDMPDKQPIANFKKNETETDEHYNLQRHIDLINAQAAKLSKFSL